MSYDAMAPEERAAFRLAGLFPGTDFSPAAISVLTDMSVAQSRASLNRLEAANLLQQHVPGRYHFHDLLRDYAQERAEAEHTAAERAEALNRLGQWYLMGASAAVDVLYTEFVRLAPPAPASTPPPFEAPHFSDESQATAWLLAERRNLLACVRFFGAQDPHHLAWHLADALRGFFWTGKYRTDWDEVTRIGLAAAEACGDQHGIASMHRSRANLHNTVGDYPRAMVHQEKSLIVHRGLGMREEVAATLNNMSLAHLSLGRVEAAQETAQQALRIAREIRSARLEASALGLLGSICWTMGKMAGATAFITESLSLADELGLHHIKSYGLRNLGLVRQATGELSGARTCFVQALEVSEAIDSSYDRSISLYGLALVDQDLGHYETALGAGQQALAAFKECGDRTYEVETMCVLSTISADMGALDDAARYAVMALKGARQIGYVDGEVYALARIAVTDRLLGNAGAAAHAQAAWERVDSSVNRMARSKVLLELAPLYLSLGDPHRAKQCAERALVLSEPGAQRLNVARAKHVLGAVAALGDDLAQARAYRREARTAFAEIGAPPSTSLRTAGLS